MAGRVSYKICCPALHSSIAMMRLLFPLVLLQLSAACLPPQHTVVLGITRLPLQRTAAQFSYLEHVNWILYLQRL